MPSTFNFPSSALLVDPRLLPRTFRLHLHNLGIAPYRPLLGLNPSRCRNRITPGPTTVF
jgi:hypothetical protein